MATSSCVRCRGTDFEAVENIPIGSAYRMIFVQCSRCGGVVGVTEFQNATALIHRLSKALERQLPMTEALVGR